MQTLAVRLYGKNDLRLERFDLPAIGPDEILAEVISDSICMSSYKAAVQGADHKRVPDDVADNPVIIGHELCGVILEVGERWKDQFHVGQCFGIQPALNYKGSLNAPGYSYQYIGGDATHIILPKEIMELGCLLPYTGNAYFYCSLSEPMSCIIGAFHANYHHMSGSSYEQTLGIIQGGNCAILAGCGPMGLGAIDYAMHSDRRPGLLVVTDVDEARIARASKLYTVEEAAKCGVKLVYVDASKPEAEAEMMALTDGKGYDDVFVFAPVAPVVEQGDRILGQDGCLNFFAGPIDPKFSAKLNFYNVHYGRTHLVGTSGGNTDDLKEALSMMGEGTLNPAGMITHVGGINAVVDTTLNLPKIPGGKKLIYTHIDMPLTAIDDFEKSDNPLFQRLAKIVAEHNGLWCAQAEKVLLENAPKL